MATKETPYTDAQMTDALRTLQGWRYADGAIRRVYETGGWPITLMLVNAIGFRAEAADHHPDLTVTYRRVSVALSTHSAGGVTGKDVELARIFDEIALWRPPQGSALAGTTEPFVS
ncbi:MAG: 4a-hydroxytetrahydrobiopterin dehydratase [Acidobacteria bacterium]|nr:4a-hydroxytetrahydrobiopterin dehydratase [Acidobacteriota bacterium]